MKQTGFKTFLLIWLGSLISEIGSGMTSFALAIYIYQLTGQASASSLIALCAFLPGLLANPWAGVLADRHDRRLLMAIGDGLSGLGVLWIYFTLKSPQPSLALICLGAAISSLFSALVHPAFRATISDLVDEEEISKASGLSQINGIARYLISPALAGLILANSSISTILLLDFSTIFVTVATSLIARHYIQTPPIKQNNHFWTEFLFGFRLVREKRGIWLLVLMGTVVSFIIGSAEILLSPMILGFSGSKEVGLVMTISSSGMLVAGLVLGFFPLKKHLHLVLSVALFLLGIFMALMSMRENLIWMYVWGFLLFAMLPFVNTASDCLVRLHIAKEVQGKAWGTIGIISQLGYLIAYASMGWIGDQVFKPLLIKGGNLANSVGRLIGVGNGRGYALLIILAGLGLSFSALILSRQTSVKELEKDVSTTNQK
ncbi:MFS transporter [Streptococcus oricebi]|uniref:MFS transporter n=1 Tax=Streptococcus oricebi TaxID=1547447 RepID=A0ABS5B267_9STRE|nr:MFS transporter [Streptococcus oricebi]MBP2622761.1 MFS transporter [Streptococcus oricebi]